jgi:hypothetical protein
VELMLLSAIAESSFERVFGDYLFKFLLALGIAFAVWLVSLPFRSTGWAASKWLGVICITLVVWAGLEWVVGHEIVRIPVAADAAGNDSTGDLEPPLSHQSCYLAGMLPNRQGSDSQQSADYSGRTGTALARMEWKIAIAGAEWESIIAAHPDCSKIVSDPLYAEWIKSLSYQELAFLEGQRLTDDWILYDSHVVVPLLNEYKNWRFAVTNADQFADRADLEDMSLRDMILEAQALLRALGYDAGAADGSIGTETTTAVWGFERAARLLERGQIDARLLRQLRAVALREDVL